MMLELPEYVDFKVLKVNEEFALNCESVWTLFPLMNVDLELEDDKTILFVYNVVLPLVMNEMTVAVYLNNMIVVSLGLYIYIYIYIYLYGEFYSQFTIYNLKF